MENFRSATLAEIVTENYRAAQVFEAYHLDFCCKGKRTLEDACQDKGIQYAEVEQALAGCIAEAGQSLPDNVLQWDATQLTVYIEEHHHRYVREQMPVIEAWLMKLASKHGGRHPELLDVLSLFSDVKAELEPHMKKEELILFPRIREAVQWENAAASYKPDLGYLLGPIIVMETEHDRAGTLMAEIREVTGNYTVPADGCTTYKLCYTSLKAFEEDLHRHVHLENNVLFPKALEVLKN